MASKTQGAFNLGKIVATPGALALFGEIPDGVYQMAQVVTRHRAGDWGELCAEDVATNDDAVKNGYRIMSNYPVNGKKVWVITEWDRSVTTILLPSEY